MKSILFIQYGDYREAYQRLADGGTETYWDQKKSVDFVASLAPDSRVTTVAFGKLTYRTELATNLWSVGIGGPKTLPADIAKVFDEAAPTHVVLRTPHMGFLREVQRRNTWLLPTFADIFSRKGIRAAINNFAFRRILDRCQTPCVSNHSLNASRSLVATLGLPPKKIVPWDFSKVPIITPAKNGLADSSRPTAFFAGMLTEDKGVGDCLEAVSHLKRNGLHFSMTFAGRGDIGRWMAVAAGFSIVDRVRFLGVISNGEVRQEMHKHDFVVVPSRHSYPEGLPNTIYEGIASRSVLIISDHPAFAGRLKPGEEVHVFPAANSKGLSQILMRAIEDRDAYQRMSENAERAHAALYAGLEWTELVRMFLEDPENSSSWVEINSLSNA